MRHARVYRQGRLWRDIALSDSFSCGSDKRGCVALQATATLDFSTCRAGESIRQAVQG